MKFQGAILLLLFLTISCKEAILHDLTELDANKILTKLYAAQVETSKKKQADGSWQVLVENNQIVQALSLIERQRFFRKFKNEKISSGLISSQEKNKLEYEQHLARSLEATLYSLPGVLEAHIHLNLRQNQFDWKQHLQETKIKESGSVLLIVSERYRLSSEEIKKIVSGASGLEVNNISVVENFPDVLNVSPFSLNVATAQEDFKLSNYIKYLFTLLIFIIGLVVFKKIYDKNKINFLQKQLATLPRV